MKTKTRVCFYEKYEELSYEWGLHHEEVIDLINDYDRQLIEEILDNTPLEISRFFKDRRTDHEYYFDLLEGRLVEDFVVLWFEARGAKVKKIGADADGRIVRSGSRRISTEPDLEVDGKQIEIQVSREGRRKKYHVKQAKGNKILRGENKLMFIVGNEYFLVDKEVIETTPIVPNGAWGGKLCFEITNPVYKSLK